MGQTSSIRTTGADPAVKADGKHSGQTIDAGPYEAIVKGHVEGTRMGQLMVSIPDWSGTLPPGNEGATSDQIVVSYASPFYGSTFGTDSGQNPDTPATAGQSYGMWLVPPDIGNKVLVTFAAGDISRGYWFACIYDSPSHHMVPAIGRNIGGSSKTSQPGAQLSAYVSGDSVLPVVEYNTSSATGFNSDGLTNTPRFPHEFQTMALVQQGLDKDPVRGAISSSSLRESPSNVYGISTPGRKATKADQNAKNPQAVFYRKGGHQFVMDDGDKEGKDQLIRLRTSSGHQILMNDTEKVLYIASATGQQWLEFSPNGSINVFGAGGFNLRSQGAINLHSDSLIAMCAPNIKIDAVMGVKAPGIPSVSITSQGNFSASAIMKATLKSDVSLSLSSLGKASLTTGAALSISSAASTSLYGTLLNIGAKSSVTSINGSLINLNCGSTAKPAPPSPAIPTVPSFLDDATWAGTGWVVAKTLPSTCKVVPTHEPWTRPAPKTA
jgi:hypothetical protein